MTEKNDNRTFHRSPRPENKWIKPETRFTEFPVLSIDSTVEISRSPSKTDDCLFLLAIFVEHRSLYNNISISSLNILQLSLYDGQLRTPFGGFR